MADLCRIRKVPSRLAAIAHPVSVSALTDPKEGAFITMGRGSFTSGGTSQLNSPLPWKERWARVLPISTAVLMYSRP
jgi:hypothetical protein